MMKTFAGGGIPLKCLDYDCQVEKYSFPTGSIAWPEKWCTLYYSQMMGEAASCPRILSGVVIRKVSRWKMGGDRSSRDRSDVLFYLMFTFIPYEQEMRGPCDDSDPLHQPFYDSFSVPSLPAWSNQRSFGALVLVRPPGSRSAGLVCLPVEPSSCPIPPVR